jgi:hypothetical protein
MPIVVNGVKQLQKAMRDIDKNLNKEMLKNIKQAMLITRDRARSYLPAQTDVLSGWAKGTASKETINYRAFPAYDYALARDNIVYSAGKNTRNQKGFSAAFYVANKSAPGAIFEWAGRKNRTQDMQSNNPQAAIQFNAAAEMLGSMKGTGQQRGRLVYRAWFETRDRVIPVVVNAIETTAKQFRKDTQIKKAA